MHMQRRTFLGAGTLLAAPRMLFAQAATERRFVFIIQRGAADGLNTVIPYAEPAYGSLRGAHAIDPTVALKMDGTFALHPALSKLRELYAGGEATFLHAVASPYRERSHFDAQNVLETGGMAGEKMGGGGSRQDAAALGRTAAGFLALADGPRIAMIETSGWDTHSRQDARLARQLSGLDSLVGGLRDGLGATWAQTVVLVATELGRTVAANGTGGTDHGTASAAMLIGGAVQGGRILSDWPGLAPGNLLDGRDLRPTLQLDKVIAAACAETFNQDPQRTTQVLFADAERYKAMPRLLRV